MVKAKPSSTLPVPRLNAKSTATAMNVVSEVKIVRDRVTLIEASRTSESGASIRGRFSRTRSNSTIVSLSE